MKKNLLYLFACLFCLSLAVACGDDSDGLDNGTRSCWLFTMTTTTTMPGVDPITTSDESELCGLTEKEASDYVKKTTTTTSAFGVKVEIKTTKKKI